MYVMTSFRPFNIKYECLEKRMAIDTSQQKSSHKNVPENFVVFKRQHDSYNIRTIRSRCYNFPRNLHESILNSQSLSTMLVRNKTRTKMDWMPRLSNWPSCYQREYTIYFNETRLFGRRIFWISSQSSFINAYIFPDLHSKENISQRTNVRGY